MGDFEKKLVGWLSIACILGITAWAVQFNMEMGPPGSLKVATKSDAPPGVDTGCMPVCLNVVGILGVLIIRLGALYYA